jgi:hypothetical protein
VSTFTIALSISLCSFGLVATAADTPFPPSSGPATGSFNRLHPKSKFLALNDKIIPALLAYTAIAVCALAADTHTGLLALFLTMTLFAHCDLSAQTRASSSENRCRCGTLLGCMIKSFNAVASPQVWLRFPTILVLFLATVVCADIPLDAKINHSP